MRRTIIVTVIAVLVVAGIGLFGLRRIQDARVAAQNNLQTTEVRRGSLVATVNTAGTIQAASAVNLVFKGSGQLKEIKVKEGDHVKAGQVLATLDTSDLELALASAEAALTIQKAKYEQTKGAANPNDIAAAEANLASAKASYEAAKTKAGLNDAQLVVARNALEKAELALRDAQAAYDRVAWRPGASALPQAKTLQQATIDYETAKANYDLQVAAINDTAVKSAYAQYMSAAANLAKLKGGLSSQEAVIAEATLRQAQISAEQARKRLEDASLIAPFDGTITRLTLQVGQMVGASTQAGTLADLSALEVQADMSEVDVAKIRVGQEVDITIDALPDRTFKGHVTKVALAGVSTQGVVNYPITIRFDQVDPAIKPGMTANASIIIDRRDNVLLTSSRAIRTQGGRRYVRVLYQGQQIDVPVQVGMTGDAGIELLGDTVKEGDVLVLNTTTSVLRNMTPGMGTAPGPTMRVIR